MGKYLKEICSTKCARNSLFKSQDRSCKQGNLDVVEFFLKLTGIWNEVENTAKRQTCMYEAANKYAKMAEQDRVHQFLMGLDDDAYSSVCSQILT